MTLKRQQFEKSENNAIKPRALKHPRVNTHDNEKGQSLDKYQNKSGRYIYLLLVFQKESNRPIDPGKGRKSLNPFLCISK